VTLLAAALGVFGPAQSASAAERPTVSTGPYVSVGYAYAGYETRCNGDGCDRRANGVRAAAGWTFLESFSVEALYLHAGDFTASDVSSNGTPFHGHAKLDVYGAALRYDYFLLERFSVGAHVGAVGAKADFTPGPAPAIAGGKTTAQFLGGLSAAWHITRALSFELGWDHTRAKMNRYNGDVDVGSINVRFGF
jgi:hypothetical protein